MSIFNYTRQRYVVLQNASAATNLGEPILSADFKTALLDLQASATLDGELVVAVSDQYEAPDVTQPFGPDNEFFEVGYSDTRNQVYYSSASRYNPASSVPGGSGQFNVENTGYRWIIAGVINRVAGTVDKLSVNLYDNQ